MNFRNYCSCSNCKNGIQGLFHAKTENEDFICGICWLYDQCTSGKDRVNHPCEDKNCQHRPKIIGEWKEFN